MYPYLKPAVPKVLLDNWFERDGEREDRLKDFLLRKNYSNRGATLKWLDAYVHRKGAGDLGDPNEELDISERADNLQRPEPIAYGEPVSLSNAGVNVETARLTYDARTKTFIPGAGYSGGKAEFRFVVGQCQQSFDITTL
ncbi:hypothetical protein HDU97_008628 [Phlyctochytrium planicorne]|nr:hypothetical protein HDU97_008628 [Phlyctochytrium planicorne]